MAHISGRVFVAPKDIEGTLLIDMQPYGYFICNGGPTFAYFAMHKLTRGLLNYMHSTVSKIILISLYNM